MIVRRSLYVAAVNWLPHHWKSRELSYFILGLHMRQFYCWAFQVQHAERCTVRNDGIHGFILSQVLSSMGPVEPHLVLVEKKRKMSRRSLWVCRLWRDHCCGLVMVSSFANWRRLCVQHQYLPACRGLRFAMVSLVAVLFPLLITREATRVGIVLASAVVMLIHGLESVNVVCCASCCAVDLDMHNRPSFHATRGRVSRTLSSSWDPRMRPFCCCSGPARWKFCTIRHDRTNDSSHHVNVAQYSMWLLDAARLCGPDIVCEMWFGAHAFECNRSEVYR